MNHLASLDLISYPSIGLIKNEESMNIEQASSGEYHLISTFIGIYASLSRNSIVLIDEPEISLHPNWQMKYMSFLKKIFNEYFNCHFIIATHSHFFASDLDGDSSTIIGLTNKKNGIEKVELIKNNTYGWSVDEILYRVFKLRTIRNHYFEYDLQNLAYLIEKKDITNSKLHDLINKLEQYEFSKIDPLTYLLKKGKELLNNK